MKPRFFLITAIIVLLSFTAFSQDNKKWSFELNAGPSWATEAPANADLNMGFGFETAFTYAFLPHTHAYLGWGWNRFGSQESSLGNEKDFEETGYVMGLQFKHPVVNEKLSWFLRAGAIYNHIEVENDNGEIQFDTKHGWGWQLASGIELPIQNRWYLRPQIKYHNLNRAITVNELNIPMDQSYLSFRIGIARTF